MEIDLLQANPPLNHQCEIARGVLGDECLALLQSFFREAREKKKVLRDGAGPNGRADEGK